MYDLSSACGALHNIKFSQYCFTIGENAVITSPYFKDHGLVMYRDVPACDLFDSNGTPGGGTAQFDYIFCESDNTVLLAVQLDGRSDSPAPQPCLEKLDIVHIRAESMQNGQVSAITGRLREMFARTGELPCEYACNLKPLDKELFAPLMDSRMLADGKAGPQLTEYGAACGLSWQVRANGNGVVMCSDRVVRSLRRLLNAGRKLRAGELPKKRLIPLAKRVGNLNAGRYSNSQNSIPFVREMADLPLDVFMDDCSEEAQGLSDKLPEDCITVSDAAVAIRDLLLSDDESVCKQGVHLMTLLAAPIVQSYKAYVSMRMTPHFVNVSPPSKLEPSGSAKSGRRLGLDGRLAQLKSETTLGDRLCDLTLVRFYQGVGAICGIGYPRWLSGALLEFFEKSPYTLYPYMLDNASQMICPDAMFYDYDDDDVDVDSDKRQQNGIELMYLLLIEPLALVNNAVSTTHQDKE